MLAIFLKTANANLNHIAPYNDENVTSTSVTRDQNQSIAMSTILSAGRK